MPVSSAVAFLTAAAVAFFRDVFVTMMCSHDACTRVWESAVTRTCFRRTRDVKPECLISKKRHFWIRLKRKNREDRAVAQRILFDPDHPDRSKLDGCPTASRSLVDVILNGAGNELWHGSVCGDQPMECRNSPYHVFCGATAYRLSNVDMRLGLVFLLVRASRHLPIADAFLPLLTETIAMKRAPDKPLRDAADDLLARASTPTEEAFGLLCREAAPAFSYRFTTGEVFTATRDAVQVAKDHFPDALATWETRRVPFRSFATSRVKAGLALLEIVRRQSHGPDYHSISDSALERVAGTPETVPY